jgi:hypothetical protein
VPWTYGPTCVYGLLQPEHRVSPSLVSHFSWRVASISGKKSVIAPALSTWRHEKRMGRRAAVIVAIHKRFMDDAKRDGEMKQSRADVVVRTALP